MQVIVQSHRVVRRHVRQVAIAVVVAAVIKSKKETLEKRIKSCKN